MVKARRILIIDDELETRDMLADLLGRKGYEVLLAADGTQGLAEAQKNLPDLVLLDIMMPEMDGFKVQEKLQADERTRDIPIVFITARTSLEDTIQAVSNGAAGYIEKPFDIKRLIKKVGSLLDEGPIY